MFSNISGKTETGQTSTNKETNSTNEKEKISAVEGRSLFFFLSLLPFFVRCLQIL